jgi:hypothetical protein
MFFVHSKAFTASTCVSAYGISGLFKILPTRGYYLQVYAVGDAPQPICPEDVRPHRCASSVSTLPLRVRSRGRAPARPMGFPPPLVPHINCEPRLPVPTERGIGQSAGTLYG